MPRIANTYSVPPGTDGFPDTTIESEKYNDFLRDIEKDLNDPRPISAGGTGANNALDALFNLGGEKSTQKVSNYSSHVWYPGSFYSEVGATFAPPAPNGQNATDIFTGWVVSSDPLPVAPITVPANQNVIVFARAFRKSGDASNTYVREKSSGTWGPWTIDGGGIASASPPDNPADGRLWWDSIGGHLYIYYTDPDGTKQWVIASPYSDPKQFLLKAGDTMQGNLTLASDPAVDMDAANKKYVDTKVAAIPAPDLSSRVAKAGDTMTGSLYNNGGAFYSILPGGAGTYYFGTNQGTKYLYYNGTEYILAGGNLSAYGNVYANGGDFRTARPGSPNAGAIFFGVDNAHYLHYDGSNWYLNGGINFQLSANVVCGSTVFSSQAFGSTSTHVVLGAAGGSVYLRPFGTVNGLNEARYDNNGNFNIKGSFAPSDGTDGGYFCKAGDANTLQGNWFNIGWGGTYANLYVDKSFLGGISTVPSDYRTKKDIQPLPDMWDTVKALKPIKYTHKDFTPPQHETKDGKPFFKGSDEERWGFVAHELQDTLIKDAAFGEKDMPNGIQSLNTSVVVAALTKALQEAMARIEQLEARV